MKRWIAILLVIGVIASTWVIYAQSKSGGEAVAPEGITTEQVVRTSFEASIHATGSLAAERSQAVAFGIGGRVAEVLVDEGDFVTQGQVLARLDTRDLELSLQQAEAALAVSEAQRLRAATGPDDQEIAAARAAGSGEGQPERPSPRAQRARPRAGPVEPRAGQKLAVGRPGQP